MLQVLRLGLLVMITCTTLSLIIALARPETGPIERSVLGAAVVGLLLAARKMQRLGSSRI